MGRLWMRAQWPRSERSSPSQPSQRWSLRGDVQEEQCARLSDDKNSARGFENKEDRIRQQYPYWSKTPKANFSSINARSDKLESSGAWREPWKHRRCLIPANFFFEWEPLTKEEEKKKLSKPWAVSLADDGLFAFGGIWDRWKGQDENKNEIIVESFSIITTDPNEVLEPFHNRCPLIIEPKDYERWLAPAEPRICRLTSFEHIRQKK
jgi:putative SOS response-associated peptidase YedK